MLLPDASWTARTVTPGRIAPVESVTVPLKTASCAEPAAGTAIIMQRTITRLTTNHGIGNLRATEVDSHRTTHRTRCDPVSQTTRARENAALMLRGGAILGPGLGPVKQPFAAVFSGPVRQIPVLFLSG